MASIFTYQEEPPRVHSPWSTPGCTTPTQAPNVILADAVDTSNYGGGQRTAITRLEPERQDGPTEYKLHLLLRSRRKFSTTPASFSPTVPAIRVIRQNSLSKSASDTAISKSLYRPSNQTRQTRLQQLTTQLLWRLQQSSPFHSSSNADLVLPVLPEATPRLGVPDRPAKLLPGLEESQGALYEIGVADDGTLVGLIDEDLEESLTNLRAMSASLGCRADILRRVLVGQCEWSDVDHDEGAKTQVSPLWVAEVLVKPDIKSPRPTPSIVSGMPDPLHDQNINRTFSPEYVQVEQLRVAFAGPSMAGKSSLVGTLTTSTLDNARGKSRLSLLKHRHEIVSGVTSSVAQELIGYREDTDASTSVVNYASGDVSSWPDIHNLADRLVFLSDSPGIPRYAKSLFRSLISWDPHWTLLCVAADEGENSSPASPLLHNEDPEQILDLSLAHLDVCVRLGLPLIVSITKMDLATKSGLRSVLSKILSALKQAGKTPVLLSSPSSSVTHQSEHTDGPVDLSVLREAEKKEIAQLIVRIQAHTVSQVVPIVLTSAVTGSGIAKIHALLNRLPLTSSELGEGSIPPSIDLAGPRRPAMFHIDEMFAIPPSKVYSQAVSDPSVDRGVVLCGHMSQGNLSIGDQLRLGPFWLEQDAGASDSNSESPKQQSCSSEHSRRPLPQPMGGCFSKSLQGDRIKVTGGAYLLSAVFVEVYVVSLRSLRLPVRSMRTGETGTVGIVQANVENTTGLTSIPLSRARKGMVLSAAPAEDLCGYRSFVATFQASDFAVASSKCPPLILGGHAIIYINSVRAAVKITSVSFGNSSSKDSADPPSVFDFDGDGDTTSNTNGEGDNGTEGDREICIIFKLVSSVEWMEVGQRVLVVPTVTVAGPISGPQPATVTGLSGFVGFISDVFT